MATTHVVLIRGINVGGRNRVPMAPLREALADAGLAPVRTYIQSGNALVDGGVRDSAGVGAVVEAVLRETFDVSTVVVTVPAATLADAVAAAPAGFGDAPARFRYDVAFLRPGWTADDAAPAFGVREGVDTLWPGPGVIYFRRLTAEAGRSRMSKVTGSPLYQEMTIRNWATTTTLAAMAAEESPTA